MLAGLLLVVAVAAAAAADYRAKLKQSEQDLLTIRNRIQAVMQELTEDRAEQDVLERELRATEERLTEISTELRNLRKQIKTKEGEAAAREAERDRADRSLKEQTGALRQQVRASFMIGRQQKAKLLLNQEDPALLGRLLAYYDYLNQARSRRITTIQQEIGLLQAAEQALASELGQLQKLQQDQQSRLGQLENVRGERNRKLGEVERRIASQDVTLRQLQREEQSVQGLLEALKRQLEDIPAEFGSAVRFGKARGKLPWPAKGPLIVSYGQRKAGTNLVWNGIWIKAKHGTPVRAVANGRVVYVGWMHKYGLIVILQHEDGYYTLYGHNQEALVAVGHQIRGGQMIAAVGDSGGHRDPGLYFEIRRGRTAQNPNQWLKRG
ncbi:MAG: murein hydrolase activator EnvC family protein [Nevskiales bacterium]